MEGSYNKVFLARESAPAASYSTFLDVLEGGRGVSVLLSWFASPSWALAQACMHADTLRDSIADGCAAAYSRLKLGDFVQLLFAKSEMDVDHLLKEVCTASFGVSHSPCCCLSL